MKERSENLGIPQSPCPLVQPLASSVPKPTRKPAIVKWVTDDCFTNTVLSKGWGVSNLCEIKFTKAEEKIMPSTMIALSLVACPL